MMREFEHPSKPLQGITTSSFNLPHFNIDVNIDGVKLFEDPLADSVTPILGRIHSVQPSADSSEGKRILWDSSPFIIGFYVGKDKPSDIKNFLEDLIGELCRLHPSNDNVEHTSNRQFTASLRLSCPFDLSLGAHTY